MSVVALPGAPGAPHHDGSARFLPEPAPSLGDTVPVFVHVPAAAGVTDAAARVVIDGEPRFQPGTVDREDGQGRWWRFAVPVENPVTSYRFLLAGAGSRRSWLTGAGVLTHDPTDHHDFRVVAGPAPPSWLADAVVYQVFPDRFARSGEISELPVWALPASWTDPPISGGMAAMHQFYGGDLIGVRQHLDHLASLGATVLYLCPVFPAPENHRYNASSFEHVDPLLGGDEALAALTAEAHRRGIRVIGDLTLNHTGHTHPWFRAAQADAASAEAGMFTFHHHPHVYEAWLAIPSLPKLDYRNPETARRMFAGHDSVARRFLRPPFSLDGWRIDVANMVARQGASDLAGPVARAFRTAVREEHPGAWVVAEHAHDATGDLRGLGWDGTMFYAGFTRPLWQWLVDPAADVSFLGDPFGVARRDGADVAQAMIDVTAAIPWRARTASLDLLGSHDTARIRSVAGTRERHLVGAGLLFSSPGVPMVFAGDEWGVEGTDAERARAPMPWPGTGLTRDDATLAAYRRLAAVRAGSPALRHGGWRWVHAGADALAYRRETADERLLVLACRQATTTRLPPVPAGAEPLLDGPGLEPDGAGAVVRVDGPAFQIWRLP